MKTPIECASLFLDDWRKQHNYPDWTTLDTDKYDTQFFIHKEDSGEVIVCFCPSNSKIDWKNNFHFWKQAYNDMDIPFRAHSGFLRCWKEVRHYIEDELEKINPECITITGYSYGGAMAILCMEDLAYLYPEKRINCITFGAPRVITWKNFNKIKDRWNKDGIRYTIEFKNGSDIVPAVPLMMWGFHHVTELTHIGQPIRFWRYIRPDIYHDIHNYLKTLKKTQGIFD